MNRGRDLGDDLPGPYRALGARAQVQWDPLDQLFDENQPA
jgi:hypothetical protein